MEEVRGHAIGIIVLLVEFGVWTTLSHSSIKLISRIFHYIAETSKAVTIADGEK
jgi:hypothetical protein